MNHSKTALTDEQQARLAALEELQDDQLDYSDIPPTTDWSTAQRGRFQVPARNRTEPPAEK